MPNPSVDLHKENNDLRKLLRIFKKRDTVAMDALRWESQHNNSKRCYEAILQIAKIKQSVSESDIPDLPYEVRERP